MEVKDVYNNRKGMGRIGYLIILILLHTLPLKGQFALRGQAAYMDGDCIQLTPDSAYSEGLAFYTVPVNLENPFQISFDLFFGDKEEGADGMTFVMHNDPRGLQAFGAWGECMGYGGWNPGNPFSNYIAPSIAVEFDTYQNLRQNDPAFDHVALLENGSNYHASYWPEDQPDFNLENGLLHDFSFQWNPAEKRVVVFLDGNMVVNEKMDLIEEIFEGKSQVIWGFTASTGRKANLQYFCLRRLARAKTAPPPKSLALPGVLNRN